MRGSVVNLVHRTVSVVTRHFFATTHGPNLTNVNGFQSLNISTILMFSRQRNLGVHSADMITYDLRFMDVGQDQTRFDHMKTSLAPAICKPTP